MRFRTGEPTQKSDQRNDESLWKTWWRIIHLILEHRNPKGNPRIARHKEKSVEKSAAKSVETRLPFRYSTVTDFAKLRG